MKLSCCMPYFPFSYIFQNTIYDISKSKQRKLAFPPRRFVDYPHSRSNVLFLCLRYFTKKLTLSSVMVGLSAYHVS